MSGRMTARLCYSVVQAFFFFFFLVQGVTVDLWTDSAGDRYYEFDGVHKRTDGSIKEFAFADGTQPSKVQAVMVWEYNKVTYLFGDKQFWRFDEVRPFSLIEYIMT